MFCSIHTSYCSFVADSSGRLAAPLCLVAPNKQVLGAGVLRAATFYYTWRFYGMAAAEKRRKENSSTAATST